MGPEFDHHGNNPTQKEMLGRNLATPRAHLPTRVGAAPPTDAPDTFGGWSAQSAVIEGTGGTVCIGGDCTFKHSDRHRQSGEPRVPTDSASCHEQATNSHKWSPESNGGGQLAAASPTHKVSPERENRWRKRGVSSFWRVRVDFRAILIDANR